MKDRPAKLITLNVCMILLFALLLGLGTFFDEGIARALYSPDNIFAKLLTSLGAFPFFSFVVLFFGALCERMTRSKHNKPFMTARVVLCILMATGVGFIGVGSFVDKDSLGSIFPSLDRNIPVIAIISAVSIPLLICAGYSLAKKTDDPLLVKRILSVLVLLGLSYLALQDLKGIMGRPRFRLVMKEYDGIGFVPWYTVFPESSHFIETLGIDKGEFRSFPSGHSILAMSVIICLESLAWFIPKLKEKRFVLGICGLLFALVIMFTRLVLGAHYLSDVSAGALISSVIALIYTVTQQKIEKTI